MCADHYCPKPLSLGLYSSDRKVSVSAWTETEYSAEYLVDTKYLVIFEYSVSAEHSVPYANQNLNQQKTSNLP